VRVPESISPLTFQSLLDNLGPRALSDLYSYLVAMYQPLQAALNGGLEVTENAGAYFTGTFDVGANTAKTFTHALGRTPVMVLTTWNDSDATNAANVYTTPTEKALWTDQNVSLLCNRNTAVTNLTFDGWAI
jgi:hypothetical protein